MNVRSETYSDVFLDVSIDILTRHLPVVPPNYFVNDFAVTIAVTPTLH